MKNFFTIMIFLFVMVILLSACDSRAEAAPDCKSAGVFCVGMVTDFGKIDDKAINQSVWAGIESARQVMGITAEYILTTDSRDYDKNISTFGESGYDVVVTAGYSLKEATARAAVIYPETSFIGVDQDQTPKDVEQTSTKNLVGLVFLEDQAGFKAGALAAQMSTSQKIGAVCSTDLVASIWRYCEGFRAGAFFINPGIDVNVVYHNDTSLDQAFIDPDWGAAMAKKMIEGGVDVLFGAGGETGNGAISAAAKEGIYVLGCDDDQFYVLPEARKRLLSSAVKLVTPGVFDLIKSAKIGEFPGGTNYTGLTDLAPFHAFANRIPDEIKNRMGVIDAGLMDGSIQTNVEPTKP